MSNSVRTAHPQTGEVQRRRKSADSAAYFMLRDKNFSSWFIVTAGHSVSQARTQPVLWHHNRTGRYYRYQMAGEGG
jgi:hypothetical protein